jgi:hypothetical protein
MAGESAVRSGIDEDDAVAGRVLRSAAMAMAGWIGVVERLRLSTS